MNEKSFVRAKVRRAPLKTCSQILHMSGNDKHTSLQATDLITNAKSFVMQAKRAKLCSAPWKTHKPARKYYAWGEVTDSDKHTSLLSYRFNYDRKNVYKTGLWPML